MIVNIEELKWIIQKVCSIDSSAKVKFVGRTWQSNLAESDFTNHDYSELKSIQINFAENSKKENNEVIIKLS